MQHNSQPDAGSCAYKLDLAKAYDRVDWGFLQGVLEKMGFQSIWVQWIMACVTTVHYRIKFNGELLQPFYPSRGLCQGDPLSPYLFLLVADSLSKLIKKEENLGRIEGIRICRRAPAISYLLFADDTLLFFKASTDQATNIRNLLNEFESGTGQLVSLGKCSILFSTGVHENVKASICNILHIEKRLLNQSTLVYQHLKAE